VAFRINAPFKVSFFIVAYEKRGSAELKCYFLKAGELILFIKPLVN
jgi:hypothetical protein